MRYGFTTGSCAAAAAKAAAYMLLSGRRKESITIETPKGIAYHAQIEDIIQAEKHVSCAVRKDGGDDPDVTTGTRIYADVSLTSSKAVYKGNQKENVTVVIDGGKGVGRITKPGLDQPVGNAAINSVPRQMIEKEVRSVCHLLDYSGTIYVTIFAPEGEKVAMQTFNPRLGIVGGISILGTTGIVEPMSSQAILETIRIELRQKKEDGAAIAAVSPGNYGLEFLKRTYGYDLEQSVKCSNFIGCTVDMVKELGFQKMLLTGHIGKLIKVAGGIMNTHSHEADCRMELLAAAAIRSGADTALLKDILDCVSTEDAVKRIKEHGCLDAVMQDVTERIVRYLLYRAGGRIQIECILYTNELGLLGKTEGADDMIAQLKKGKGEDE